MIRRHNGFSLLEILVAFAIMAVALTIVLRIFGSGVNNAVISEEYTLAVQIAESLMARVGVETPLQAGELAGTEGDKYDWQVVIRPVASSGTETPENTSADTGLDSSSAIIPNLQLLSVVVRVVWGEDESAQRTIELSSLKTVQVEQP